MQTDMRSDIHRHQNSQKPHLRKGSGGGTSRRAPILAATKIIGGLGIVFIINRCISIITIILYTSFTFILLYFLDFVVDLHKYSSIHMYHIRTIIIMMLITSMCE